MMAAGVILAVIAFQFAPLADAPQQIVDQVWQTADEHYALFEAKGIDWSALGDEHRSRIGDDASDEELFDALAAMLSALDDDQVRLQAPALDREFSAGILGREAAGRGLDDISPFFDQRPLARSAFTSEPRLAGDDRIQYGWVGDRVGYLHLARVDDAGATDAALDAILTELADARAWIVDVRASRGDDGRAATAVADRFADRRRLYAVSRERDGTRHDDFDEPRYWHVDRTRLPVAGPVILLTGRHTLGAAEHLALAMRTLPQVTVVGDTTAGSMADRAWFNLHNGWRLALSRNQVADYAERCWEGIGVPPDVVADGDLDQAFATALDLLEGDGPPLQDEHASAMAARHDLVEILAELLEDGSFPAVQDDFDRIRRDANPETSHADRDEINALGYEMLRDDRVDDAVGVFLIYVELMPGDYNAHDSLGEAYLERGDTEQAIVSYERSLELNPDNRNAVRMLRRLR
jgi:carboxyl-terminal processing protease